MFNLTERINLKILWVNMIWMFVISLIPFTTAWVGKHPTSFVPLSVYFADMALSSTTFHLLYALILRERGDKVKFGIKNFVSLAVYILAAGLGGFCPIAAYVIVAAVSLWWIFPPRKKAARYATS